MAEGLDLKTVVKHLANGSLGDSLCVVCLLPLTEDNYESIFTSICKLDKQFCIADILRDVCQLKISEADHYNICSNCFQSAVAAYRFHLKVKSSFEILNFYTDQLFLNIKNLDIKEEDNKQLFCIHLPDYNVQSFNFFCDGIGMRKMGDDISNDDVDEVIVVVEDDKTIMYHVKNDALQPMDEVESDDENVLMIVNERQRKKRDPMMSISCLHCPVRYRFVSKLKEHMKKIHNADIYYCKICKLITDKKDDYEEHLTTHIGKYQCTECNTVYSKEASLVEHLKSHELYKCAAKNMVETGNICEICGVILEDENALETHRSERHVKKFTCFYCGRMYKGHASFELHIQKHEKHLKKLNNPPKKQETKPKIDVEKENEEKSSKRAICGVCGKSFVDERSLLWHQRLHNNDRPFVCNICSRGFVSLNRRNQHATCAHSRPRRRCPLCPALFHLRSMVNTHVKKVHLNRQNKRRTRAVKHTNVFWKTETVPIQELSVSIQNAVLEMQNSLGEMNKAQTHYTKPTPQHHTMDLSIEMPNASQTAAKDGVSDVMKSTDLLAMQEDYEFRNDFLTLPLPVSGIFKTK